MFISKTTYGAPELVIWHGRNKIKTNSSRFPKYIFPNFTDLAIPPNPFYFFCGVIPPPCYQGVIHRGRLDISEAEYQSLYLYLSSGSHPTPRPIPYRVTADSSWFGNK